MTTASIKVRFFDTAVQRDKTRVVAVKWADTSTAAGIRDAADRAEVVVGSWRNIARDTIEATAYMGADMTWLPIPPEAARSMCLSVDCPSSATCALHEDSGTKPHERQTHTVRFPQPGTGRCAAYRKARLTND